MTALTALITTSDATAQLGLPDASDPELQTYIDASVRAVERIKGSIIGRDFIEPCDGGRNGIALRHAPVYAISSVTESGNVLDDSDYTLYAGAGILVRNSGAWAGGAQSVTVAYTAGRDVAEPDWKVAALIVLQDLWATRLSSTAPLRPGGSGSMDDDALTRSNYRLPRRAMELLGTPMPGIA